MSVYLIFKINIFLKLDWFEFFVNKNDIVKFEYNDYGYCEFMVM